jgi:hypothetical protein
MYDQSCLNHSTNIKSFSLSNDYYSSHLIGEDTEPREVKQLARNHIAREVPKSSSKPLYHTALLGVADKDLGPGIRNLGLKFWLILGKLLPLSEAQFSHLSSGNHSLQSVVGRTKDMYCVT